MALGLIATSTGSGTPFNATWDMIEAKVTGSDATAALTVTAGGGINASTYSNNSFQLTNNSPSGQKITRAEIDLRTSLFPDMVFDPDGTAGDLTAKPFTVNTNPGVGTITHGYSEPEGIGGFAVLEIDFAGGNFDSGETLGFSIDVDPTSITGVSAPGPGDSGSVSGLEMVGTTVTVFFDDGSSYAANLYSDGGLAGALAVVGLNVAAAPTIEVLNLTPPVAVSNATQTVRVTGPANGTAQLLIVEGALFEQPGGGVDIQPFEANSAIAKQEILAIALNGSGVADVPITLTRSDPDGGLNHLVAIVAGTSVQTSASLVIEYDPDLPSSSSCALVRINAGGPAFTGSDGRQWLADQEFVGGSTTTNAVSIDNTVDDTLYQSERSGAFIYEIALPNGTFDVNLMFAEIY